MGQRDLKIIGNENTALRDARCDLAAAFRLAARFGYHEAIANHFSLAVSDDGAEFLINPYGRHFARMRASDLLLLDANRSAAEAEAWHVEPTAWCIHGPIHRLVPRARCILHTHMKYATVLSALRDSSLPAIDQNTMRFYGRVALDECFEGMALTETEGERLAGILADKSVLIMGNHGVMVVAPTVGRALDELYYFEKACETVITAYMTGRDLRVVSESVAHRTAKEWETYTDASERHFSELKAILDEDSPGYRD